MFNAMAVFYMKFGAQQYVYRMLEAAFIIGVLVTFKNGRELFIFRSAGQRLRSKGNEI